jgi:hypothetical protein
MAALTVSQHLNYGTPVTGHVIALWTTISQKAVGTTVTQKADGSAGRTLVQGH